MRTALDRPPEQASPDHDGRVARQPVKRIANVPLPGLAALGVAAVLLHALDAWVLRVEGETSPDRRALYLAMVVLGGVICSHAGRALSKRLRAIGLLTTGVLGLVIVGPILGSYVDKQGLAGNRFTGGLALIGAIALIAIGTTRLLKMTKTRWRKLLALPIAFVVAQFFVLPAATSILATQAARPPLPATTPADLGMSYQDEIIRAADGTKLAAWYIDSANGAAVLLRHGSGSTRANLLHHAAFLAEAGYGVLLVDARGHGESEGRINELGWHGAQDIEAALDYLETRPDVSGGIGILGLSMGGEEALVAAAFDQRIEGVVAEGAGVSSYDDSIANGAHVTARFINWTQYAMTDLLSDASQPAGIRTSMPLIAPRPVLLITGDESIEKTVGPIYAAAGGATTQLLMLPETPHTDGLKRHPTEYVGRVLRLFEESLLLHK